MSAAAALDEHGLQRLGGPQKLRHRTQARGYQQRAYRRRAGSCSASHRARASADGRAYLARDVMEVWPLLVISIGADMPSSAR
jgi:hypothetical protein